jgi:hypothetical protein
LSLSCIVFSPSFVLFDLLTPGRRLPGEPRQPA